MGRLKINFSERTTKLLATILAGLLGDLLAYLSFSLTPLNAQVSFDFSHLASFTIAIAFGPWYGALAAAVASIYPYFKLAVFGIYGPWAGLAIIFGKTLTGFFCGLLKRKMAIFMAIAFSYIPESIFTFIFLQVMSGILPPGTLTWQIIINSVILEGWVEILMFAIIIDTIVRRKVIETAVLMLEIFIIMFLVHKEFIESLFLILAITFCTLILFEIIEPMMKKHNILPPNHKH